MQTSGAMRRESAKLYQRHCERSEAIHGAAKRKNGLLRFARNDVETRAPRSGSSPCGGCEAAVSKGPNAPTA